MKIVYCPQIYIYIVSVITAIILAIKYNKPKKSIEFLLSGLITVIILNGINYCDWQFQWLTWVFAALSILSALIRVYLIINNDEITDKLVKKML